MRKEKKIHMFFLQMFCPCVYMYVCVCKLGINPLKKRRKEEKRKGKRDS